MKEYSQQVADPEWKQLLRLGEQITDQATPEAQCNLIARSIGQILQAQARVWLASPAYPLPGSSEMEILPHSLGTPLAHLAFAEQKPQFAPLPATGDSPTHFVEPLSMALPMVTKDNLLGIVQVDRSEGPAFSSQEVSLLESIVAHAALAMEVSRQETLKNLRKEQMSTVYDISYTLASILDLDLLLNEIVRLIQSRSRFQVINLYTVHPGRRLVTHQAGSGEQFKSTDMPRRNFPLDAPQGIVTWVARNGRTFLTNDVSKEPLFLSFELAASEVGSEIAIPLMTGDEVLGVLDIQSQEINAFDQNDRSLLEALAAPIGVAMHNAILYRSEQWRRKVAESFRDVAHLISANLPLNQLLEIILEKLENILPCDASAVWLLDEEAEQGNNHHLPRLRLAAVRNIEPERIFEVLPETAVREMLERALAAGQPLIRKPEDPYGPLGEALRFEKEYSSIAAPMQTGQRPLGIITLAHRQGGRYGSEAQAITATFSSYAAVAIQNVRLYNETQAQAFISTMLLQVAEASQSIMSINDLLATMIRMTRLLVGVKKSAFLVWEDGLQSFELKDRYGFDLQGEAPFLFSSQLPAITRLLTERTTLYIDNPSYELNLPELSLSPEPGTVMMLPLLVRGEAIGAFLVSLQMAWAPGIEKGFDPKALSILQGIAHQTSITIDNLRLQEARQEEAYVTAALLQVAQTVVSTNDLNDTLDTIVHLLPILVGINTCVIYLWDSNNQLFRPTQAYAESRREEEAILNHPFSPADHGMLNVVRKTGEMHLCHAPQGGLSFIDWGRLPYQSHNQRIDPARLSHGDWVMGYPLSLQGQVLGVLLVRETNISPAFWERRTEITSGIAQQISLAIQNDLLKQEMVQTERIEREIQLARQIQETFLPNSLPQFHRWELDMRWETAREVGGDFYDIFKLGGNRVGLVIADVSDKGLPAALYMTVARTLIRANATDNHSPADVLEEVNRLLVNDSPEAMFITTVYVILSLETGELVYANAGHNRPLVYRWKKRALEQLPKGGTALGILDDLKLENHALQVGPGDSLILYTDGVTDALSPESEMFGEERLFDLVRQHGKETVQDLLEYLDDALIEFRRGLAPVDDITMVAVRREPKRRRNGAGTRKKSDLTRGGAEESMQLS